MACFAPEIDTACFAPTHGVFRPREGGVVRCGEWTEGALSALRPELAPCAAGAEHSRAQVCYAVESS
jgi:hypothetical protein